MTDGRDAQPATNALGVVDPIRIPIPAALPRAWRRLPTLGRVFVGLTILDIVARALGIAGIQLGIEPSIPITFISAFVPHDLLILFPALLLARRPDAGRATPFVLRGAILVALVELLSQPLGSLATSVGEGAIAASLVVSITGMVMQAAGWIAIAAGLAALASPEPTRFLGGLANLVFGTLAVSAVVSLAWALAGPRNDLGDPIANTLLLLNSAMFVVATFAWAFLGRVIVRGAADSRRPLVATRLAVAAFGIIAVLAALQALIVSAVSVQAALGPGLGSMPGSGEMAALTAIALADAWLGSFLGMAAVIVAFGLGLADTSAGEP